VAPTVLVVIEVIPTSPLQILASALELQVAALRRAMSDVAGREQHDPVVESTVHSPSEVHVFWRPLHELLAFPSQTTARADCAERRDRTTRSDGFVMVEVSSLQGIGIVLDVVVSTLPHGTKTMFFARLAMSRVCMLLEQCPGCMRRVNGIGGTMT